MGDVCVFVLSRCFCRSMGLFTIQVFIYVYGCLDWFSVRGSCLSLSLIGNHIQAAMFFGYFVGYCLCDVACQHSVSIVVTVGLLFCLFSVLRVFLSFIKSMYSHHAAFWSPHYDDCDTQVLGTQVLGKMHKGRLLLERGVSHSQTALAINYPSVCSLRRGSTSRSWYFILPNHYLIQWHISIVNSRYSHLKYNSSWTTHGEE